MDAAPAIPQKIADFFAAYPLREFDKRQLLLRPDEALPGVFYLVDGRVSQYDVTPAGNEVVVNVFKPGAFFPMSAALNNVPNAYFYEASLKTAARVAPVADAVQFVQDNPDVALDLLKRVYRGVDGVLRRMAHLMGGGAKHRLLFEVLNAAYRFGEPQANGSLLVALNEGDLARLSGLARETVNRNMQELKGTGLLTLGRSGIAIPDVKALDALLGDTV
ncbi:MAG TPA: Crp/Fnr family transcriptional regulator [Candidatus Saccharimonadales bacterium]|nr:Crp/Fnr family transcriptional regulator [Candidatus Saccharimonadales bacterium]